VNGQHLQAFFWLRWRLFINQLKRGGIANAVILAILGAAGALLAVGTFVIAFFVGLFAMPSASPQEHLYVWDGFVIIFLFWWGIGILTDLQRSEALSLDKFLHLPVSLTSAFLINYLSSLLSLSTIVLVPAMVGFILGSILGEGPALVLLLPLLTAFLLMVTALTYQFQGWLAALMANKRRRQTIIVAITMSSVLLCQLPNLINVLRPWDNHQPDEQFAAYAREQAELKQSADARRITLEEYAQRKQKLADEFAARTKQRKQQAQETLESVGWIVNLVLPPGWLPLGAMGIAEGNPVPALLGTVGLTLIGTASLWRAYRTTLRYYTGVGSGVKGQIDKEKGRKEEGELGSGSISRSPVLPVSPSGASRPAFFFEKKVLGASEPAAAIALASFRSLVRAPEAKLMLLSPIFLVIVFGSMFVSRTMDPPAELRPLFPFAAMALVLFSMIALAGNQFGFDRSGFRVYVLSPARRADILLGKNLAIAPLALGLGAILALLLEALYTMRLDYLLAVPAQLISMFLIFCLVANFLSICAPMAIRAGSLRAAQPRGLTILLHLAFTFLFPLALAPTLLPLGIEFLLERVAAGSLSFLRALPLYLIFTWLECVLIVYLYRLALTWQGNLLQSREQRILELVTVKSE
jgi:hypothetical protein